MAITMSLAAALIAALGGVLIARLLHLSEFASVAFAFIPGMLIAFPTIKAFVGTALKFWQWAITIGLGVLSTWFIYLLIGR